MPTKMQAMKTKPTTGNILSCFFSYDSSHACTKNNVQNNSQNIKK